ncbi:hypothetical protein [Myroides odoratus]|uniref:hypothetical protein n=1 Tax=Myroides odoratus TaxID=256 RepID=UPI0039AF25CE
MLITIACKKEHKNDEYTQEEYNTIEDFMNSQLKVFDRELLNIEVLQINQITTSNVDSIKKNIKETTFLMANLDRTKGQPTDSILKIYNSLLGVSLINNDKPIGKLIFVKVTALPPTKIEEIGYFPIPLNKRNNIPADLHDLLYD